MENKGKEAQQVPDFVICGYITWQRAIQHETKFLSCHATQEWVSLQMNNGCLMMLEQRTGEVCVSVCVFSK